MSEKIVYDIKPICGTWTFHGAAAKLVRDTQAEKKKINKFYCKQRTIQFLLNELYEIKQREIKNNKNT